MLNFKSFQSVSLIGRLGADAQLSKTKSGTPMLSMSVATSESVKNAEGHYDQKTVWHKPIFFGARAEKVASTLVKGTLLSIQAHLSYRKEGESDVDHRRRFPDSFFAEERCGGFRPQQSSGSEESSCVGPL